MLASADIIRCVVDAVAHRNLPLVVDPVMYFIPFRHRLLQSEAHRSLVTDLFPIALLITPNLPEASVLLDGRVIASVTDMQQAAVDLMALGRSKFVLVKGGHLESDTVVDVLYDGESFDLFSSPRVHTTNTHAGATLVASWTCFVLSIDAFAKLYPDGMVGFVFPVVNMSSLLVITMFMLVAGRQLPLHVRMAGGFGSLLLSILVVPLLQLVPNIDIQVRYVGTLIMVIVTSMASALIQSSIYGLGAVFGPSFLQAIDGGKGTGAVLLVFARIATKWTYDHDTPGMLSLCVFFGLACVTIAVSWTLYVSHAFMLNNGDMLVPTALPLPSPMRSPQKQQLFQVYPFYLLKRLNRRCDQTFAPTETTPIVDKEHNTDVGSILTVLRLSWKPVSMSFVTFCVCLACYPGLTTAIQSNSIGQTWFPVVLTAAFTVGDLVGKSLPLTIRLLTLDTLHYPLVVQAAYIPLFVLAVVYSNAVSDIAAIALVTSLGFVTGYVGTSAMILAPTPCSDVEHEVAGMTGSMATIAGLFAGSYIYLMVVVADVFSAEEAELVAMQFSLANRRNARDLDKLEATVLFKEHAPEFSPHDLKTIFAGIEAKGTFQLNVNEYLEIKANKKIELEAIDEEDLKRHFTVLDYHGNGSLVATEITEALEKTGDSGVDVLKEAIQHATTLSTDGTITFELFRVAIHDMNRKNQAAIAAGMIRIYRLQAKLQEQALKRRASNTHETSIQIEYQVLVAQTQRQQAQLITAQNDLFSKVYGIIVAQYMCQTRVLQAFRTFFDHLHTEVDSHLFRHNLEKNGRVVAVHPSFLLTPGPVIEQSPAYADLCNFMIPDMVYDTDNHGPLFTNRAYRKIFLWYCLLGSLTNLQTMGRTNFLRFARDCRVADLSDRPILDADLDACYVVAIREPRVASPQKRVVDSESFHFHFKPTPPLFEHTTKHHSNTHGGGMTFKQWVHGTTLLLCRCLNLEEIVQEYNAAKLDVGFSKTESRESLDLNFHEFLRCIQRLAMAMNRSLSSSSSAAAAGIDGRMFAYTKHHSLVSSFQHFRSDMQSPGHHGRRRPPNNITPNDVDSIRNAQVCRPQANTFTPDDTAIAAVFPAVLGHAAVVPGRVPPHQNHPSPANARRIAPCCESAVDHF
ncbi:hypothetical protein DYB25_004166 [Aphanomyces astaci]|uniref:Pyridoxamine kinase/Phosphomethylpyrimidine kinase domain-containing protein n=1 Tax=Aphanomyces astaci TaxID=112090 RepID=A0A396ZS29_APHAT|nr:hypothetical protein DYB25_004166 [Aphanomyces astaci]